MDGVRRLPLWLTAVLLLWLAVLVTYAVATEQFEVQVFPPKLAPIRADVPNATTTGPNRSITTAEPRDGPALLSAQGQGDYVGTCPEGFSALGVSPGVARFEFVRIASVPGGRLEANILHGGGKRRSPIQPQSKVLCVEE